jgi:hypothetical protein
MSRLTVDVTLAPYIREEILKIVSQFKNLQDTPENRAELAAVVSYQLHCRTGVPPGTFVVTTRSEDE